MNGGDFAWNIAADCNFGRDVVDVLGREDRLGMLFLDAAGCKHEIAFPDIANITQRYAAAFRNVGIERGDRVIVVLPKVPAWLYVMVGLCRIGAVVVPCAEQLRAKDLTFRANHSGATTIVAHSSNREEVDRLRGETPKLRQFLLCGDDVVPRWRSLDREVARAETFAGVATRSDEPAYIVYTSGTTNDPKGVVHSHAWMQASRSQAHLWLDARPGDLVWCTAGTGWAKSLWNVLLGPWSCGAAIVLDEGVFDAERRMDTIAALGVDVLCQAPTEYRLEAKLDGLGERWQLPTMRHCVSAGEPLNPEVLERWRAAFGITILDGYGQTENTLLVANLPGIAVRPGSMGMPMPGHEIDVIDEDGRPLEAGGVGDIALRGNPPTLFLGYYRDDEETAASRRGEWYVTGDRGRKDDDGYYWFVGRADDVISSGAYRIGPFEVESALLEHPAVLESAVVGTPDADRGNVVKAFVVLRATYAASADLTKDLQDHCKRITAPYKYPREIEYVDALPKTSSGKIRRVELRQAELRKKGATAASGFE